MRSTAAPYTESRLARLVRNKRVGFPVVEQRLPGVLDTTLQVTSNKYGRSGGGGVGFGLIWSALNPSVCGGVGCPRNSVDT